MGAILVLALPGVAQQFQARFTLPLSDSVHYESLEWIELDNDGLMDILAHAQDPLGRHRMFLFRNDTTTGPEFQRSLETGMRITAYHIADVNGDNAMDIILSGERNGAPLTEVYLNQGDFALDPQSQIPEKAGLIRFNDLNQDGTSELILSGKKGTNGFLKIYTFRNSAWETVNDTLGIQAFSLEVLDVDADGDNDLFVNGMDADQKRVTMALQNEGSFVFSRLPLEGGGTGSASVADVNYDGALDVVWSGKGEDARLRVGYYINRSGKFVMVDSLDGTYPAGIFTADLTSDGKSELALFGTDARGDSVNRIHVAEQVHDLDHRFVITQRFGDHDRDGDLDLLQLQKNDVGYSLLILRNTEPDKNLYPAKPFNPVAAYFLDRLFLYWEKPSDDHTPRASLTYDLAIQNTEGEILTGHFDLVTGNRLIPAHGNQGTRNHVMLRVPDPGIFNFQVQAVDNALHGGVGGLCVGSGGCTTVETQVVEACRNEEVFLSASSDALWFSFSKGFLHRGPEYSFTVQQQDTVFSVQISPGSVCSLITVFIIEPVKKRIKVTDTVRFACKGETLIFETDPAWESIAWSSSLKGFLSNQESIRFTVTAADTVQLLVSDDSGCTLQYNTALVLSIPELSVATEAFQILKGESVQLHATGTGSFLWSPSSSLNDPAVSNPVASPATTTEYTITLTDSLGCTAQAKVVVVVEPTAFVPGLFTPNQDGKNDALKIYGLQQANRFSFVIYNREGSVVYSTEDINNAVNQGWNGTSGGVQQPGGVYYWKVKGETPGGKPLLVNGKRSGSIVLVR